MKYLNLGCGNRFHPHWKNVDFVSTNDQVIAHDLTTGIPFPDAYFEVVYHSHVLEHFPKNLADFFLKECYRVLGNGGILRIAVPDLEQIANLYLKSLEKIRNGSQEWGNYYEWILLEMYDQSVRNQSGGEMLKYCLQENLPNKEFLINRCGIEIKNLINQPNNLNISQNQSKLKKFISRLGNIQKYSQYLREVLLKVLLGKEYQSLQLGRFRQGGEIHQWMYDDYSLRKLLENCGFQQIVRQTATESYISDWTEYNLDTESDGTVYKPDSLFMEAIKP